MIGVCDSAFQAASALRKASEALPLKPASGSASIRQVTWPPESNSNQRALRPLSPSRVNIGRSEFWLSAGQEQVVVRHLQAGGGPVGDPVGEAVEVAQLAGLARARLGVVEDVDFGEVAIGHGVAVDARLAEGAEHQVEDAVGAVGVATEEEQGALTLDEGRRPPDLELHAVGGAPAGDAHQEAALAHRSP